MIDKKWNLNYKAKKGKKLSVDEIIKVLLKNRGLKGKKEFKEFISPTHPNDLSLKSLGITSSEIGRTIERIRKAKSKKEKVYIYGDYDADGICATAILWECLYYKGVDTTPYIPERFSEGYGLNYKSVKSIKEKEKTLSLIITVDNGIVANKEIEKINALGIDVIITDHHERGKTLPKAHSIIHTTKISGAALSWILSREIGKKIRLKKKNDVPPGGLELAALGTIADILPLTKENRSFAKHGLKELNETKRAGLRALFKEASIKKGNIGVYEVGFIIAPRLNSTGRLKHAIESLRLLCVKDVQKAKDLASYLGKTNMQRQKVVEDVISHAKVVAEKKKEEGIIIIAHKTYHEGVIGLAASKIVQEFYRPAIVFSKGKEKSKASARSIPGFNMIETIRKIDYLLLDGGGHPMAAGFSIETQKIEEFTDEIKHVSKSLLKDELFQKKINVDLEIDFSQISWNLAKELKKLEPTGFGNPTPIFKASKVNVLAIRTVGFEGRHLKMRLENRGKVLDAIGFGLGNYLLKITSGSEIDVLFNIEENVWNNVKSLQLKIKDIKI